MVMGTKKITMSANKPSSGSSKGSSSRTTSQDSEPKCSSEEVITTLTKITSGGITKKGKSNKKGGYASMSQQLGKLPEAPQKSVAQFQQHFIRYDGEKFEQLEYWQSQDGNSKDIGMGDIQQCKLEVAQAPQCFGFPHNPREYVTPFKVRLILNSTATKSWCQTINFYAFSLTCNDYENFAGWEPNFEATGLLGHQCSEQIQMHYNRQLFVEQEFVNLKFKSSSSMSPRYLVFICKVGKDILAARYSIPTIILSRKNDQFCRAFDILLVRGSVPRANIVYLIERDIMTEQMWIIMQKDPPSQITQPEIPFDWFCETFLCKYGSLKFKRIISKEELQVMYRRLYTNDSAQIDLWCHCTVALLGSIRSLWEITFPFPLICTFDYQKKKSEDILSDTEYGDFIIRVAYSQQGALAVTHINDEIVHTYSVQTNLEFEPKNEICRRIDQTIIFNSHNDVQENCAGLIVQRLKQKKQLRNLVCVVEGQKRRFSKQYVIELCRQADVNIFPGNIIKDSIQQKRDIQEVIRRYGNNNDNIFEDIMDNNDPGDQPDLEMIDFIQNNNNSSSPIIGSCQEGYKTYAFHNHNRFYQKNNIAQNQHNSTTNFNLINQHDTQVLHNLHNVHVPHMQRGRNTMHALPPPFSLNFPSSRVNYENFNLVPSAPNYVGPPSSMGDLRRNFPIPPPPQTNQQYQRQIYIQPSGFIVPQNFSSQGLVPQNLSSQSMAQQAYNEVNNIQYSTVPTVPLSMVPESTVSLPQQQQQQFGTYNIVPPITRVESTPVQERKSIFIEEDLMRSCSENQASKKQDFGMGDSNNINVDDTNVDFLMGGSDPNLQGENEEEIFNLDNLWSDYSMPKTPKQLP